MKNIQTSRVISFDGIDGSGKTTLINNVKEHLEAKGHKVKVVAEPRGTEFGKDIYDVVLSNCPNPLSAIYAMFAARSEVFITQVQPFLTQDEGFVLLDRHVFSTLAYQAGCSGGLQHVVGVLYSAFRWAMESSNKAQSPSDIPLLPELAVICHVSPEVAVKRITHRLIEQGGVLEPWEKVNAEVLHGILEGYGETFTRISKQRGFSNQQFEILDIDADLDQESMTTAVMERIRNTFEI